MTRLEFQIIEMFGRVFAFCELHADQLPKESLVGKALTSIQGATTKSYELAVLQNPRSVQAFTDARAVLREALTGELVAIRETAVAIAIDQPGLDLKFRLPAFPRQDRALIETGNKFAKAAEPFKADFVAHHLPEDFIDSLKSAVGSFQQAIDSQNAARSVRFEASTNLTKAIDDALTDLQRVESIVKNTFRGNKAVLDAWDSARHVTKSRRLKGRGKGVKVVAPVVAEPAKAGEEAATPAG